MTPRTAPRARQNGRTLIELMVAVAIGLAVVAGLVSVYLASSRAARASSATASAEFAGNVLMTLIGDAIKQAGYGEIVGGDATVRTGQTLFDGNGVTGCENGRFADAPAGDFDCVPAAGDTLMVRFQADSVGSPPQGPLRDCLGSAAPMVAYAGSGIGAGALRPLVTNVYSLQAAAAGGAARAGSIVCQGSGALAAGVAAGAQPLIGGVEAFKVFYGFDEAAMRLPPGSGNAAPSAGVFRGANSIRAQAGGLDPWGFVVSVYVCVQVRTEEGAVGALRDTAAQVCPRNEVEVGGDLPTQQFTDGAVRRTFVQVFTVRSQATANPLVGMGGPGG